MQEPIERDRRADSGRTPSLAAVLSFVVPGLGDAYLGRVHAAAVFAFPVALLVVAVLLVAGGFVDTRRILLSSGFLVSVGVVNVALLGWRLAAIAHAGLLPWRGVSDGAGRVRLAVVAGLVILTAGMHAWVGALVVQVEATLGQVFDGPPVIPVPTASHAEAGEEPEATPEPTYRWDGTDRINVLLIGTDLTPDRETMLTDVLLVVSVDPVEESAVMISVPRDTGFVPLLDETLFADGLYPNKVNGLLATAAQDPATWCPDRPNDGASCGLRTLIGSVGLYIGLDIHHHALVDMARFAELIDALGGVRLCLPGELVDPNFDGSLENRGPGEPLVLPEGCHHYDGLEALAYARSRQGWIDMPDGTREYQTDFHRNERQQRLLLALREEVAEADTLLELPGILTAVGRTVSTDVPRDQAGDLASLLPLITGPSIERVVLGWPDYVDLPANPEVAYILVPRRDAIRERMAELFGDENLDGWYLGTPAGPPSEPSDDAGAEGGSS
jgi:polyisoprenyl-teichoic acid--peptidoglycan teichoic acid transferase